MLRLALSAALALLFGGEGEPKPTDAAPATVAAAPFPPPEMNPPRTDVEPFRYRDVGKKIPNYTPGEKWGEQGEPHSQMQEPLSPEESLKHMVVPRGFHVELFAAEPDLGGKPIAIAWDERGRLWVAETYDYPNELQPQGEGRDRIRICEDTDGDGRADKITVFAEQLSIPTSLTFASGGVVVFDGRQTVFLKDTDGDDVADERTVLFGTWEQGDTHGGPSNMRYGLDNWIWAMQGYNDSKLEVGGQSHRFRQGFFRFRPDGSRLEFLRSTDNNTWGLGISEEGLVFGSTANRNPSVHMPIANRHYERVRGWTPRLVLESIADTHLFQPITDNVRQVDHFGGYTAGAGHALYTARRYPQEYWNRTAFVCGPTGHLVGTFVLEPEGSGFRSTLPFNLLASDDEWTAPIAADVGPDGNVWVVDWYNYIVQHNPTPRGFETGKGRAYETDLRDKLRGRIVRVVCDEPNPAASDSPGSLAGATPGKLVQTLAHTNQFWRRHAQRLLVERGQIDVLPQLIALVEDRSRDAIGLNVGAIHALWTMHGLGALDGENQEALAAVRAALAHPSDGVRQNAVQVLPPGADSVETILTARLLADPSPRVRLAALLALADNPASSGAGRYVATLYRDDSNIEDRWIREAMICAAAGDSEGFLRALPDEKPREELVEAASIVAEHRARTGPHRSIHWLVEPLVAMDASLAEAVFAGLARGWPDDVHPTLINNDEQQLEALLPRLSLAGRATLVQLATGWKSPRFKRYAEELIASLLERVDDASLSADERIAAARRLVAFRPTDAETAEKLLDRITPRLEPAVAAGLLEALTASQLDSTGEMIAGKLSALTPATRAAGVRTLLARRTWAAALIDAIEEAKLAWTDLSLDQQRALSEHPDRRLRTRAQELLARGGVLPNADRRKVLEEMLPLADRSGDAERGRQVFKKQCAKCHVHGSEGTRIGPDLTGIAVHPKQELLENILDPSRSVEGNYRVFTLATADGRVLTGLLAAESKTAVELFDSEGKRHTVVREDIEELVASPKSLMPEGFEKQIPPEELVDLLEFLAARGKYLPLPLDKVATATSTRGMFYDPASSRERLVFDDWQPKEFAGVPFQLVDPGTDGTANVVLLRGTRGLTSSMPRSVSLPCNAPAAAIHLLGGVSGWGHPLGEAGSTSLIVRLHYADRQTEDHELKNGEHLADYIRRVDVPGSEFAFDLDGRQLRYLAIQPKRSETIERIELVKGPDATAPVVMAVTVELPPR